MPPKGTYVRDLYDAPLLKLPSYICSTRPSTYQEMRQFNTRSETSFAPGIPGAVGNSLKLPRGNSRYDIYLRGSARSGLGE